MIALREKLARALTECRRTVRAENDVALAADGLWTDPSKVPTDEQYVSVILATIEESGMVIVPREATEEMVEAVAAAMYDQRQRFVATPNKTEFGDLAPVTREILLGMSRPVIEAMLAAAPKEPTS